MLLVRLLVSSSLVVVSSFGALKVWGGFLTASGRCPNPTLFKGQLYIVCLPDFSDDNDSWQKRIYLWLSS